MGVCGKMVNALDQKTLTRLEAGRSLAGFFYEKEKHSIRVTWNCEMQRLHASWIVSKSHWAAQVVRDFQCLDREQLSFILL